MDEALSQSLHFFLLVRLGGCLYKLSRYRYVPFGASWWFSISEADIEGVCTTSPSGTLTSRSLPMSPIERKCKNFHEMQCHFPCALVASAILVVVQ